MKTKTLLFVTAFLMITNIFAQKSTIELTFTAVDFEAYQQLDSVKIINRSLWQVDTTLYFPDSTIIITWFTGTNESISSGEEFRVFQNHPNPVKNYTTLSLYIPDKDFVDIMITDVMGRNIKNYHLMLDKGHHSFRFEPGKGNLFVFTAKWRKQSSSIKIISNNQYSMGNGSLKYLGSNYSPSQSKKAQATQDFFFAPGDILLYVGYANGMESGIYNTPEVDETITFQFAYDTICPGIPEVTYEGQVYTTVQIFSQCWLHENLNVGALVLATEDMEDNGIIEKYCIIDWESYCDFLGGLYQWDEMMQYNNNNEQGICPSGWHIPSDEEWKILEGAADSQYGIGDVLWDEFGERGFDAGYNLKKEDNWSVSGGGSNIYGFTAWAGGYRAIDSTTPGNSYFGCFWTREFQKGHILSYDQITIIRNFYDTNQGFSVRCIKD